MVQVGGPSATGPAPEEPEDPGSHEEHDSDDGEPQQSMDDEAQDGEYGPDDEEGDDEPDHDLMVPQWAAWEPATTESTVGVLSRSSSLIEGRLARSGGFSPQQRPSNALATPQQQGE